MLAFLGLPLGGELALLVVGPVEGVVSGALGGALAGAVIGAAQWLVLRRYLRVGPEWILATALGVAIGDALGALLTGAGTAIGTLLITGLATGVAVGLLQWGLVLRGRLKNSFALSCAPGSGTEYVVFVVFWTCSRALLESRPGRQPLFQQAGVFSEVRTALVQHL